MSSPDSRPLPRTQMAPEASNPRPILQRKSSIKKATDSVVLLRRRLSGSNTSSEKTPCGSLDRKSASLWARLSLGKRPQTVSFSPDGL